MSLLVPLLEFNQELIKAPSKRRPKIVDAVWTLYPSAEFVDEIISGNQEMKEYREAGGGRKAASAGISKRARAGQIRALFSLFRRISDSQNISYKIGTLSYPFIPKN